MEENSFYGIKSKSKKIVMFSQNGVAKEKRGCLNKFREPNESAKLRKKEKQRKGQSGCFRFGQGGNDAVCKVQGVFGREPFYSDSAYGKII